MAPNKCNKEKEIGILFEKIDSLNNSNTQSKTNQATMAVKIDNIEKEIGAVNTKLDNLPGELAKMFVSSVEFEKEKVRNSIARKIVFGGVAVILITFVGFLIDTVVLK